MHQREQEKCARDRALATKLRDIATDVRCHRNLVEAAYMAAHNLSDHERDPLVELLALISERLVTTADTILAQANREDADDVA